MPPHVYQLFVFVCRQSMGQYCDEVRRQVEQKHTRDVALTRGRYGIILACFSIVSLIAPAVEWRLTDDNRTRNSDITQVVVFILLLAWTVWVACFNLRSDDAIREMSNNKRRSLLHRYQTSWDISAQHVQLIATYGGDCGGEDE